MKVSILGCGRWGAFHAWYAPQFGHQTTIWGRPGSRRRAELAKTRRNQYLQISDDVVVSDDLDRTLASAEAVIVAVGAQDLRDLSGIVRGHLDRGPSRGRGHPEHGFARVLRSGRFLVHSLLGQGPGFRRGLAFSRQFPRAGLGPLVRLSHQRGG